MLSTFGDSKSQREVIAKPALAHTNTVKNSVRPGAAVLKRAPGEKSSFVGLLLHLKLELKRMWRRENYGLQKFYSDCHKGSNSLESIECKYGTSKV